MIKAKFTLTVQLWQTTTEEKCYVITPIVEDGVWDLPSSGATI